ncbi:MAG: hypothetical protein M1493_12840 [Firmicutes bacterium]|nr:hypothetical protein [Bacillota bacterium]
MLLTPRLGWGGSSPIIALVKSLDTDVGGIQVQTLSGVLGDHQGQRGNATDARPFD